MKIELVFWTWTKGGEDIYLTEESVWLSMGLFHGGTSFNGTIELDEQDAEELAEALSKGYSPMFMVHEQTA